MKVHELVNWLTEKRIRVQTFNRVKKDEIYIGLDDFLSLSVHYTDKTRKISRIVLNNVEYKFSNKQNIDIFLERLNDLYT